VAGAVYQWSMISFKRQRYENALKIQRGRTHGGNVAALPNGNVREAPHA